MSDTLSHVVMSRGAHHPVNSDTKVHVGVVHQWVGVLILWHKTHTPIHHKPSEVTQQFNECIRHELSQPHGSSSWVVWL